MRFICFCLPWMARSGTPGRIFEKASCTNRTCLHAEKNTIVLHLMCDLMNDHTRRSLSGRSHIITCCESACGVTTPTASSTEMYSGEESDSRARSRTDLVCVAEKSNVWRSGGRYSMIELSVVRKPMSSSRSASSNTKTFKELTSNAGVCSKSINDMSERDRQGKKKKKERKKSHSHTLQ